MNDNSADSIPPLSPDPGTEGAPIELCRDAISLRESVARRSGGSLSRFFTGGGAFFRGVGFVLRNPRFLPLVIAPMILNLILFVFLIWLAFQYFDQVENWFFTERSGEAWTDTLLDWLTVAGSWFAWLIFWAFVGVFWFYTFVTLGSILSAPFNDYLSECIERRLIPEHTVPFPGLWTMMREILRGILHETLRGLLLLTVYVLLLPLWLIPVVGTILYAVIIWYITIWYLIWDGMDYSLARRRLRFADKWAFYRRHRSLTFGMGTAVFFLFWIPLLPLLIIPLNVAGGTVLFCEIVVESGDTGERG